MRFSVGYQLPPREGPSIVQIVEEFHPHVQEVYFAWPGDASGRAPLPHDSRQRLEADLEALRRMQVSLNLLLNASCYGPAAHSRALARQVTERVGWLRERFGLDAVTTLSPAIADVLKRQFPGLHVRASVNMRLGTVQAYRYVRHLFDGFTMAREYNRDLERISELKRWCDGEGKTLHLLANSGCLPWCAVQSYHDNLVAHEAEVDPAGRVSDHIPGACWEFFGRRENWMEFLRGTWIRPEDARHYEPYVQCLKLATRMHPAPRRVVRAYALGRFAGNLADLLEPSQAPLFAPFVWDNARFPGDWFRRVTETAPAEQAIAYCAGVCQRVLVHSGEVRAPAGDRTA